MSASDEPGEDISADVVRRLQRGDVTALAEVYRMYGDRVYTACRRITGSDQDAEDATQDVFIRVLAQASKFGGHCRFSTWLFRVAINHAINLCRANRRRANHSLPDQGDTLPEESQPPPLESAVLREERQHLDEALQLLPVDQRTILVLREIEGMAYTEIAEVLDLPTGTVTSRLVRARHRLAEMLHRRLAPKDSP